VDLLGKSFYVGEHGRSMDEKLRVALPTKWRPENEVEDMFLALPNPIGCITVYPPKMVVRLEEKISEVSLGDRRGQMVLAKLFSRADTFCCDGKGRIKIDERLIKHGDILREVVFVGGGSTFSIWNPEKFKVYMQQESLEDVASILKGLGL
jgi:MraZ protein